VATRLGFPPAARSPRQRSSVVRASSHTVWCSAMPDFACGSAKYSVSGKAQTAVYVHGHDATPLQYGFTPTVRKTATEFRELG
jgi:hypothetical protein